MLRVYVRTEGVDMLTRISVGMLAAGVLLASTAADAADRRVRIVNDTSFNMVGLYASNIGANTWQENIFAGRILKPGKEIVVDMYDGTQYCRYDFKAVFSDRSTAVQRNVNVCKVETWTVHDGD
jgi:hypothetical protein